MSEYGGAKAAHPTPAPEASVSVPFIVLASVLCGLGLFGTAYWLVTFHWWAFLSLAPLIVGAYLLFTRGTGPDRA